MPEADGGGVRPTEPHVGRTEPGLGPYRGPVVVLALVAAIGVIGLLIALVGAVRAPDDVSNSATVLGTFPIDPDAEGIPAGPAGAQGATTVPVAGGAGPSTSVPASTPSSSTPSSSTPGTTAEPAGPDAEVLDAFDGDLADWEPVDGDWAVADGDLVVPAGSDDEPTFLLRTEPGPGIGAEVAAPGRAAGLVVGYAAPDTYVTALEVPALGGWRLEAVVAGEVVDSASAPSSTRVGSTAVLVVQDDRVALLVDGVEVGTLPLPDGAGDRVGLVSRGPAAARWASALAPPTG